MQLPLLSNLLGLGGPQPQPPTSAASEPGAGFAQLLAGVPVPMPVPVPVPVLVPMPAPMPVLAPAPAPVSVPVPIAAPVPVPVSAPLPAPAPEVLVPSPAAPVIVFAPAQASPQIAAQPEQISNLDPVTAQMPAAKPATTGKGLPHTGKHPPTLLDPSPNQPMPAAELPEKPAMKLAELQPAADKLEPAPISPASAALASAELAMLPNPGPLAPLPAPAKSMPPERQLTAAAALTLPFAAPTLPSGKAREQLPSQPTTLAPVEVAIGPTPASPPTLATIPLARIHSHRLPQERRTAEPAPPPPPAPLANLQLTAPEPAANASSIESSAAPKIELGQIIERLVENRIQSHETRSEVKLAHPDFGRVTLALNLAGQDRISLTMPDAPAELRAAVGQAFAPPTRQEITPPAPAPDSTFSSGNDARSQDARRDQQSSSARPDQSRANTEAAQNRQFTTNRDNGRKSSGRGVLA